MVLNERNGDVTGVWEGKSVSYVKRTFQRIYGVGPGIASMIVLLLEKCFKVHFKDVDHKSMDVKPDVHIVRAFYRLDLIKEPNSTEAVKAARRFNPEYLGALDAPTWVVGRKWCTSFAPRCEECPLESACLQNLDEINILDGKCYKEGVNNDSNNYSLFGKEE